MKDKIISKEEFKAMWNKKSEKKLANWEKNKLLIMAGVFYKYTREEREKIREDINFLSEEEIDLIYNIYNKEIKEYYRNETKANEVFQELREKINKEIYEKTKGMRDVFYSDIYRWTQNILKDYKYKKYYRILENKVYSYIVRLIESFNLKIFTS